MSAAAPTPASRPRRLGSDVDAVVIDGTTVLFAAGELHELNPSATAIWLACDGSRSVAAIAGDLAARFDVDAGAMAAEVAGAVDVLSARGLLTTDPNVPIRSMEVLEPTPLCASCGEGPAYERQLVVDVGDAVLTIGTDAGLVGPLTAALGDGVVLGVLPEPAGRPSYGVVVPDATSARRLREVPRLHRGPDVLVRARRAQRVLDALVTLVSHHRAPDSLRLDALPVGDGTRVVLVPPPTNRVAFERAAARAGLAVGDLASVVVDPEQQTATLGPVGLHIDREPLRQVAAARGDVGYEPPSLAWGTVPVAAVAVRGTPTPTSAFAELAPLLAGVPARLEPVLAFARAVPIIEGIEVATIVAALRR